MEAEEGEGRECRGEVDGKEGKREGGGWEMIEFPFSPFHFTRNVSKYGRKEMVKISPSYSEFPLHLCKSSNRQHHSLVFHYISLANTYTHIHM